MKNIPQHFQITKKKYRFLSFIIIYLCKASFDKDYIPWRGLNSFKSKLTLKNSENTKNLMQQFYNIIVSFYDSSPIYQIKKILNLILLI
jgi:hypothetical protein